MMQILQLAVDILKMMTASGEKIQYNSYLYIANTEYRYYCYKDMLHLEQALICCSDSELKSLLCINAYTLEIIPPDIYDRDVLVNINVNNKNCLVYLNTDKFIRLSELEKYYENISPLDCNPTIGGIRTKFKRNVNYEKLYNMGQANIKDFAENIHSIEKEKKFMSEFKSKPFYETTDESESKATVLFPSGSPSEEDEALIKNLDNIMNGFNDNTIMPEQRHIRGNDIVNNNPNQVPNMASNVPINNQNNVYPYGVNNQPNINQNMVQNMPYYNMPNYAPPQVPNMASNMPVNNQNNMYYNNNNQPYNNQNMTVNTPNINYHNMPNYNRNNPYNNQIQNNNMNQNIRYNNIPVNTNINTTPQQQIQPQNNQSQYAQSQYTHSAYENQSIINKSLSAKDADNISTDTYRLKRQQIMSKVNQFDIEEDENNKDEKKKKGLLSKLFGSKD